MGYLFGVGEVELSAANEEETAKVWATVGRRRGAKSSVRGHVDQWSPTLIGWVYDAESPGETTQLAVFVDDVEVARFAAMEPRADVVGAGHHALNCGFSFAIADYIDNATNVRVVDVSSGEELFATPVDSRFRLLTPRARLEDAGIESIRAEFGDVESLTAATNNSRSVAFISAYRNHLESAEPLRWLVASLQAQNIAVVVIDSSKAEPSGSVGAEALLWRKNSGFDFASWFTAFEKYESVVAECDRLYLLNDSCIGPLAGLDDLLEKGWNLGTDVWSCTDSWNHGYHLQSYFLAFDMTTVARDALRRFVEAYGNPLLKRDVITEGELAISRHLLAEGVQIAAVYPYNSLVQSFLDSFERELGRKMGESSVRALREVNSTYLPQDVVAMTVIFDSIRAGHPLNPTHAFWRQLLDVGFPFVKRDLMARDPSGMSDHTEILETLSKMSSQELLEMMLEDLKRRGSNRVQSLNA
jgi:hypothetical protein